MPSKPTQYHTHLSTQCEHNNLARVFACVRQLLDVGLRKECDGYIHGALSVDVRYGGVIRVPT